MENTYIHKVQYYETDQMGIVHHSNYIRWFEEARIYFLEQSNLNYENLEAEGIISPVTAVECKYKSPARFGQSVNISVKLQNFNGITFSITYEVTDFVTGEIRAEGSSSHCFLRNGGKLISLKKESKKYYDMFSLLVNKHE
ncbi:MAG: acyl-CoA thioesterase [Sedimentibacter saalensis]|uniref:acyl-CoA thioesterase n=1 Tax=Sedimentibacter saalensis TaxID=130788 RepID=UPI0031581A6B